MSFDCLAFGFLELEALYFAVFLLAQTLIRLTHCLGPYSGRLVAFSRQSSYSVLTTLSLTWPIALGNLHYITFYSPWAF